MSNIVEELRWKKFPVLNDGFVTLVDCMGDDAAIVQAARVSFGKGTKSVSDDRGLIRFLMRNHHGTPFEMAEVKLLVRVPMDCWRQWIRHRTASVNEYSTRYSEAIDSCQQTPADGWRLQAVANRQGSGGFLPAKTVRSQSPRGAEFADEIVVGGDELSLRERGFQDDAMSLYRHRLACGVAREQARKDLPLSTYTEAYWKCDLRNIFHFLGLRMDSHAQKEIRDYANMIGHEIIKPLFPISWEAFLDYQLNSVTLSAPEIEAIRLVTLAKSKGWDVPGAAFVHITNNREREECREKLANLGVIDKGIE